MDGKTSWCWCLNLEITCFQGCQASYHQLPWGEGEKKTHPELFLEFGATSFGKEREVLGQAPFHDYMFGTGSLSMAGELIDRLILLRTHGGFRSQ